MLVKELLKYVKGWSLIECWLLFCWVSFMLLLWLYTRKIGDYDYKTLY